MPKPVLTALLAAVVLAPVLGEDQLLSNSYKGQAPPELVAGEGHWANTPKPLTLAALRGKVVYLDFGFDH